MTSLTIKSTFARLDLQSSIVAVMKVDPVTVRPENSIVEARLRMKECAVNHFAVVNDLHQVVGILSATDFRKSAIEKHTKNTLKSDCTCDNEACIAKKKKGCLLNVQVKDIMTNSITSFSPDDTIGFAADTFLRQVFHVAPVIEDGKFVGILTSHDLLRCAFADVLPLNA